MIKTAKEERLNIRIEQNLKEEFSAICKARSLNASALIRQWINEFVEENRVKPQKMDILDIVWNLNENKDNSIKPFCLSVADRLGYEDAPAELYDDVAELLIERAKKRGSFEEIDETQYGKALVNNEVLYFKILQGGGSWCTTLPAWLDLVDFD